MSHTAIELPIYHQNLRVIITPSEAWRKECHELIMHVHDFPNSDVRGWVVREDPFTWNIVVFLNPDFSTKECVHESVHIAQELIAYCGMRADDNEHMAYLVSYIAEKIMELHPTYQNEEQP